VRWYRPAPMPPDRPPTLVKPVAALVMAIALLLGAAACSGQDTTGSPDTPESVADTTSTTATPTGAQIATAKVPSLTVLASAPAELELPATTTTAPPKTAHQPIPRVGLNSAAVRKVPEGYQFDNPTYFGNPLTMQVLEQHGDWLKVLIQARPNHTTGWVKASDVDVTSTTYRMELSLADRHLTVYDGDTVVAETDVVIGKETTPTPLGTFYISEKIQQSNPGGSYGPWILSTNGYSEALDLFDNGLPVVAFHGTNKPELIGTQASNGCIRLPNDVIQELADTLPAGTPVEIVAGPLTAASAPGTSLATAA
jgi:lipoprotein-anchoring transpeptidase ErfK/SrfK